MYPYINIGELSLPVYGLLIISSYIIGLYLTVPIGKKYGLLKEYILVAGSFCALGLLIGAKILYMLTNLPDFVKNQELYANNTLYQNLEYLFSGYVFYGGLIGAIIGLYIYCHIFKFNFGTFINVLTPLIPFTHAFGRIGCFFGGCCYGIEYNGLGHIDFAYNELSPHLHEVSRFPVQLLESILNLILFIFIYRYSRKVQPVGKTLGIYLVFYSIIRFLLEFLRGDVIRGFLLGLSTSQWISLILLPLGIYLFKKR